MSGSDANQYSDLTASELSRRRLLGRIGGSLLAWRSGTEMAVEGSSMDVIPFPRSSATTTGPSYTITA